MMKHMNVLDAREVLTSKLPERRLLALAGVALLGGMTVNAAERRPNFLFIYADDHRWDAMGHIQREQGERARFPWLKTPRMDRLAHEGVRFSNAFVTFSLCAPSRAAYLTGRYNHLNGVYNNNTAFPTNSVTYASQLRTAGYRTAYIGKWHMGNQSGQRPGFDYSASIVGQGRFQDCPVEINGVLTETKGWLDDVSTDFAIKWIKDNRSQAFAMAIGFKSPHTPRGGANLPERLRNLYAGETVHPPVNARANAIYRNPRPPDDPPNNWEGAKGNEAQLDYCRHVTGIDENLGRMMDALDELGLADDTVVVYTSDNGYYLGEHNTGDKRTVFEESLRIPMLVRYPRLFGKGKTVDEMVLNIDLAPTFLDMAGVSIPPEMQGRSWNGLASGQTVENWRQSFLVEYFREPIAAVPTLVGIRTINAKLVKYPLNPEWIEVFDLPRDPYETNNLTAKSALYTNLNAELEYQMKAMKYTLPRGVRL
jgi:arylsulfatase A-like enzyme